MTVTTSYPGIYLSEDASLSFSVTSSVTAIPLFLRDRCAGNHLPDGAVYIFNSFAEFQSISDINKDTSWTFYNVIKAWFFNGGGKCYMSGAASVTEIVGMYDDITLVVAAGTDNQHYSDFLDLVNQGYRLFGLFDSQDEKIKTSDSPDTIMAGFASSNSAAVYYPWCNADWGGKVPPSVVAAIAIAKTDSTRGPWKAPANVVIEGITPQYPVSDDLQGRFNQGKALNMIRTFPDAGTVVWGVRTLEDSDNWRYIPVRRLFNMVERDIRNSLQKLVFEPNSQPTWQRVKAAIDIYLYRLWQQGALAGNKESDAWFVEIGKDITMTDEDINQGKMIVKVALAAVRPAEFILLQFSQDIAQ